jgi:hypothetical protein
MEVCMAAWLPAVKIILPYLTQIVTAAIPAFTRKAGKGADDEVTLRQIAELQDAATRNAESIRTLASQMEQMVQGLDAASARIGKEVRTTLWLAIAAFALSTAAMGLSLYTWLR